MSEHDVGQLLAYVAITAGVCAFVGGLVAQVLYDVVYDLLPFRSRAVYGEDQNAIYDYKTGERIF